MEILTSCRFSLVELLYRIYCCNFHALKPRIVYQRIGNVKTRPPTLLSLTHVQALQTLDVFWWISWIFPYLVHKEKTLNSNVLSNLLWGKQQFSRLVQARLKKKSAVLMIPFSKTFQPNILRLPDANILPLISLFYNIYQTENLFCFYSFTLSSFLSDYALVRFVMFFLLECCRFSCNLKYFGPIL